MIFSIHPYHDDLYEGRYFDTGYGESSSDSEDSNDENNSRNEYPDTDTGDDSIGDDDIRRAVNNLNIGMSSILGRFWFKLKLFVRMFTFASRGQPIF